MTLSFNLLKSFFKTIFGFFYRVFQIKKHFNFVFFIWRFNAKKIVIGTIRKLRYALNNPKSPLLYWVFFFKKFKTDAKLKSKIRSEKRQVDFNGYVTLNKVKSLDKLYLSKNLYLNLIYDVRYSYILFPVKLFTYHVYSIIIYLESLFFFKNYFNNKFLFRIYYRLQHLHNGFYVFSKNYTNRKTNFTLYINTIFLGLKSFAKAFRFWLLPVIVVLFIVYYSLITRALPFNKVIFIWVTVAMVLYWLMSGFVFFFKKYQYGKYTSVIQRFWKRSYILFWLLESCLLLVFVYLTFIASQESVYMFDAIQIYKTHLFSWRLFLLKIIPVVILLILVYFILLTLKWNIFSKHSIWLLTITFILTYIIWLEFYQFFHIVNFYGNLNWVYDSDERLWVLELEARRTRIVNNYVMWLLILKFWHLLFVYVFWLFFVLRSNEIKRIRYPLLAANYQNMIILYIMSWLYMYPWIKLYFRRFMDMPYFWFYVNNRSFFWRILFNDIKILWYGVWNTTYHSYNIDLNSSFSIKFVPFFYWLDSNSTYSFFQNKKFYIKNEIISVLNSSYNKYYSLKENFDILIMFLKRVPLIKNYTKEILFFLESNNILTYYFFLKK